MSIARRIQAGLTLVEMIIFIVVLGAAVAGVLAIMNVTSKHSGDS